ncbi:MAG TPA: arylsulfatase [Luteolibacter sp.]|nr:arylsulfatase [Luteolibacter sp.]
MLGVAHILSAVAGILAAIRHILATIRHILALVACVFASIVSGAATSRPAATAVPGPAATGSTTVSCLHLTCSDNGKEYRRCRPWDRKLCSHAGSNPGPLEKLRGGSKKIQAPGKAPQAPWTGAERSGTGRRSHEMISRNPWLRRIVLVCLAPWQLFCAAAADATKPNIIYILTDDVGYGDVGCYGATHVKTPHIDRLAKEGTRFTDAHSTASVCTPTRYALLTGRYAWREPGTGIAPGDAPALIKPGTPTIASLLKQAGYTTGVIGKWHLGLGEGRPDFNGQIKPGPLEIGFDHAFIIPATGDRVPCVFIENHRVVGLDPADPIQVSFGTKIGNEPTGRDPGVELKIKGDRGHSDSVINGIPRIGYMTGGKAAHWVDETIADTLTEKAVRFIEANQASPFFLYLSTHDIHEPMVPHPRFRGSSDCGWRGDVIHQLDWTVGQVLDTLDRLKLTDNTLVIFTSDNGGAIKNTYQDGTNELHGRQKPNGSLRGFKSSLYEGGHRVPYIARWPGHVPGGASSTALMGHVDTLATLAALTGQSLPAHAGPDSFNQLSAWLGHKDAPPARDHLVLQNNGQRPLALREGTWSLIQGGNNNQEKRGGHELYDLAKDPSQSQNLAAEQPERVAAMAQRLRKIIEEGKSRP